MSEDREKLPKPKGPFKEQFERQLRMPLREYELKYKATNNPLYVWHGFKFWLKSEKPMPQWIKDYFTEASETLTKKKPRNTKNSDDFICECLKLKSTRGQHGTPFNKYEQSEREWDVFFTINAILTEHPNETVDSICKSLAQEYSRDAKTLKDQYYYRSKIAKELANKASS